MPNEVLRRGTLTWSGEHWINYIREPGSATNSGMVSLYNTRYSAAGQGIAAFVDIPGQDGFAALCTDNREVAEFVLASMIRGKSTPFDHDLPVVDARFTQGGDIRRDPSWTIETVERRVVSTWRVTEPPTIMYGPASSGEPIEIFSALYFTDKTSMALDGREIEGNPYRRDIWRRSIGGDRSSCVFALAETFIRTG